MACSCWFHEGLGRRPGRRQDFHRTRKRRQGPVHPVPGIVPTALEGVHGGQPTWHICSRPATIARTARGACNKLLRSTPPRAAAPSGSIPSYSASHAHPVDCTRARYPAHWQARQPDEPRGLPVPLAIRKSSPGAKRPCAGSRSDNFRITVSATTGKVAGT